MVVPLRNKLFKRRSGRFCRECAVDVPKPIFREINASYFYKRQRMIACASVGALNCLWKEKQIWEAVGVSPIFLWLPLYLQRAMCSTMASMKWLNAKSLQTPQPVVHNNTTKSMVSTRTSLRSARLQRVNLFNLKSCSRCSRIFQARKRGFPYQRSSGEQPELIRTTLQVMENFNHCVTKTFSRLHANHIEFECSKVISVQCLIWVLVL